MTRYQIKKKELSGDISKFPPVQWHSLPSWLLFIFIVFHWVSLTKEELKAYQSLESYN